MQITEFKSISEVLGHELQKRKKRNGSYSLRAFARDLSLSPSRLSEVMKGEQGLSEESIHSISKKISRRLAEQNYLKDIVLAQFSRNEKVRLEAHKRIDEARKVESIKRISDDNFALIADWYHGAILELIQLADFKSDVSWIAKRLGLKNSIAAIAVERLERLGLIRRSPAGHWCAVPEASVTADDVPSIARRRFHQQILSMHAESLHADPIGEREFNSVIMAVPTSKLPELREEMQQFLIQFWQKIEHEPKDSLYSISLQFCPVKNRRPAGDSNV